MKRRVPILASMFIALVLAQVVGAQGVRLKFATLAPDGSFWMEEFHRAAAEIEERTEGRVSFRFYPGGTMGTDAAVLRKMRIGQLHGGVFLAGSFAGIDPDLEIYNLPLLFRSYDEVDFVRERLDGTLVEGLEQKGYVAFGLTETGFTYLMSAKPTRTFDDLQGRKAWMPQGDPISLAIVEAAGLSPVPLPISDVLTGLQTGLIDTVAAPPVGAIALQWFTKAKYLTNLPITYITGATVMTEKAFQRLDSRDQATVREVMGEANKNIDSRSRIDNQKAREALVKQGVSIVEPTEETRTKWTEIAAAATEKLLDQREYDPALLAEVEELLESYRNREAPITPGG